MRCLKIGAAAAAIMLTGGCASGLAVSRASDAPKSREGFAYALQFTQYKMKIQRRVADCPNGVPKPEIKAEISQGMVDDGDHVYTISPSSLAGPMKVTDMQIVWEEGRLKSINASAEDRTAQTIAAVAQGIAKLAPSIAQLVAGNQGYAPLTCRADTIHQLAQAKSATGRIKELEEQMGKRRLTIADYQARLTTGGENKDTRKKLQEEVNALAADTSSLEGEQKKLKTALEFLTHEETVTWPERSTEFESTALPISPQAVTKWFVVPRPDALSQTNLQPLTEAQRRTLEAPFLKHESSQFAELAKKFQVFARVERVGSYGRAAVNGAAYPDDDAGPRAGLRYRLPAQGALTLVNRVDCPPPVLGAPAEPCTPIGPTTVATAKGPILQLGQIFYVPFSSPIFSGGSVSMAFDSLGRPVSAGIKRSSGAEAAATAFKSVAEQVPTVVDALHTTRLERVQNELAYLKASKELFDAQKAIEQSLVETLAEETALAKAQKEHADALRALEANPNADAVAAKAGFEADAAMMAAETARIRAEIALRDARAQLAATSGQ